MTTKKDVDSLYWVVEQWAAGLQHRVAASHAKRGGTAVIMTRKPSGQVALEQDYGDDIASRMSEVATK